MIGSRFGWWQRAGFDVVVIVATFALVLAGWTVWRSWHQWDPLGDYPLQRVTNTLPGFDVPAVMVGGGDVVTEATKCNASGKPVNVKGGGRWTSVDPAGFSTDYQTGQAVRLPGCTRTTYRSPLPPQVLDRVADLCRHGHCQTVWRKDGYEVPVDSHGREGEQRLWFTGNFTIVVPG